MTEFFVGLLVVFLITCVFFFGALLFPLLLLLGFFLRFVIGVFLCLFVIWFVGKLTLVAIDRIKPQKK